MRSARSVSYDANYAVIYSEVLAEVTAQYPEFVQENAVRGRIRTPWFQVRLASEDDSVGTGAGFSTATTTAPKRYFVRFDIAVTGEGPWRVLVDGQASSWELGQGVPVPLQGGDEPPWLQGRINSLQVGIHRRLESYAVADQPPDEPVAPAPAEVAMPAGGFGDIPAPAAQAVAAALRASRMRDVDAMAALLHDDFVWSRGAPPGAPSALVLWRADDTALAALAAALDAGCARAPDRTGAGGEAVVCPPEPTPGQSRATFTPDPAGAWKLQAFVPDE